MLLLLLNEATQRELRLPFFHAFQPAHKEDIAMKIEIPNSLRAFTGNQPAVEVKAATVADAVSDLTSRYPDFQKHLYTAEGKLRSFVNLYLNDEDVRYLPEREGTEVKDSDTLSIIPSIAGGLPAGGADAPSAQDWPSRRLRLRRKGAGAEAGPDKGVGGDWHSPTLSFGHGWHPGKRIF